MPRSTKPAPPTIIEVIARAALFRHDRLLVCWNLSGNYGYLPGGHVEPNESAAAALARELIEEARQPIKVGQLLCLHQNRFSTAKRVHHELNLVYAAGLSGPGAKAKVPAITAAEDDLDFRWLSRAELKAADFRPEPARLWLLKNWRALSGAKWPTQRVDTLETLN